MIHLKNISGFMLNTKFLNKDEINIFRTHNGAHRGLLLSMVVIILGNLNRKSALLVWVACVRFSGISLHKNDDSGHISHLIYLIHRQFVEKRRKHNKSFQPSNNYLKFHKMNIQEFSVQRIPTSKDN